MSIAQAEHRPSLVRAIVGLIFVPVAISVSLMIGATAISMVVKHTYGIELGRWGAYIAEYTAFVREWLGYVALSAVHAVYPGFSVPRLFSEWASIYFSIGGSLSSALVFGFGRDSSLVAGTMYWLLLLLLWPLWFAVGFIVYVLSSLGIIDFDPMSRIGPSWETIKLSLLSPRLFVVSLTWLVLDLLGKLAVFGLGLLF